MRKLKSLEQVLRETEESGVDPRDLVVDEDDVLSLEDLDDVEENPGDEED